MEGNLYALNANTGAELWSYSPGSTVSSSAAVVANGVVYGAAFAQRQCVGVERYYYRRTAVDSPPDSPLHLFFTRRGEAMRVYVNGGDGDLDAWNASTGAKLWSYSTGTQRVPRPPLWMG